MPATLNSGDVQKQRMTGMPAYLEQKPLKPYTERSTYMVILTNAGSCMASWQWETPVAAVLMGRERGTLSWILLEFSRLQIKKKISPHSCGREKEKPSWNTPRSFSRTKAYSPQEKAFSKALFTYRERNWLNRLHHKQGKLICPTAKELFK